MARARKRVAIRRAMQLQVLVLFIIFLLLLILVIGPGTICETLVDWYENVTFATDPSASLAFAYGERHFNASDSLDYNLARAEYFYKIAAAKDPSTPYLFHEMARIQFLQGNFTQALSLIDLQISLHGDSEPNSYYVRALIEGYMGDYTGSALDYQHFLQYDPHDWAALNDYAWVLLKAGRFQDAAAVTAQGLQEFPGNPWLLNSASIALFELGHDQAALTDAQEAVAAGETITPDEWLHAYPGNDPSAAKEGIATFRQAATDNMHSIEAAFSTSTVQ